MITKPNQMNFDAKKLSVIIAGVAGIGKTTLALSAPKPLLLDLDNGVSRVEARYRTDTAVVKTYDELMNDLRTADLSEYETIVIDTGGKLLEMLKPVVIAENAQNGQRDGNLSLKGYGAIKRKFASFIQFVKSLDKHLVLVFHATEVNLDNDVTGLRIRMEGSSRDDVWDDIDIGGFIEMVGKKRTIGFSNCERYYAKGTHGVHGTYEIPSLDATKPNTFLTQLFNMIKQDLRNETQAVEAYNKVINEFKPLIANAQSKDDLNSVFQKLASAKHELTSKEELWFALNEKAKELGATYDKETTRFN